MFEVNFFEKKQKNYLPALLGAFTLIMLMGIGLYFFAAYTSLVRQDERNKEWLVTEAEQVLISRQIKNYAETAAQLNDEKSLFEEMKYPMATAAELLVKRIPGGSGNITSFYLTAENQLTLVLGNLSVAQIDETVLDFRKQEYVVNVQLVRVESESDDTGSLAEIWVTLDEATLRGEAAQ